MNVEFRLLERAVSSRIECCECGGHAEGNVTLSDSNGSKIGELCDKCDARITREEDGAL